MRIPTKLNMNQQIAAAAFKQGTQEVINLLAPVLTEHYPLHDKPRLPLVLSALLTLAVEIAKKHLNMPRKAFDSIVNSLWPESSIMLP